MILHEKDVRRRLSISEPDNFIYIVILAAFIERMIMFFFLGSGATNDSDDIAYIRSGIEFARTGTITVWSSYPTASIMPGMPVVTGIFARIFGAGAHDIYIYRFCAYLLDIIRLRDGLCVL